MEDALPEPGINVGSYRFADFDYADDVTIFQEIWWFLVNFLKFSENH